MKSPDWILIGAAKAGTTALYHYLRQHPRIFLSPVVKEPHYFNAGSSAAFLGDFTPPVRTPEDYARLFEPALAGQAIGEISPFYLCDPEAAERIHRALPRVKLAAVLRQPADRAFSHYSMYVRNGHETRSFEQAINGPDTGVRRRYKGLGFYHAQLKPYFDLFGKDRLRIYLYEDFVSDPRAMMADFCGFIGVDPDFHPDISERHNHSGMPRSRGLDLFLKRPHAVKDWLRPFVPKAWRGRIVNTMRRQNLAPQPPMRPETRARLTEEYRTDIQSLSNLIDRDLNTWLAPRASAGKAV